MKKLILSLSTSLIFTCVEAQNNPITFNPGGNAGGDIFGIKVTENGNNTTKFHIYRNFTYETSDNDRLVIDAGGNVGIGTSNPTQKLDIFNASSFNTNMESQAQDHISLSATDPGNGGFFGGITWKSGGRRRASIVATREKADSDYVGIAFFTRGTDGPGPFYESMRITRSGNVGIGTSTPDSKLSVNGTVHAKEVQVDLNGWPDYVFEENYELKTLEEVETYISENKHLPEIPSEMEVTENGINLGEMNAKLLQKIEELTLYLIEQNKELKVQKEENENQQAMIEKLQNEVSALKKE